jgi:hypothetical protein
MSKARVNDLFSLINEYDLLVAVDHIDFDYESAHDNNPNYIIYVSKDNSRYAKILFTNCSKTEGRILLQKLQKIARAKKIKLD